MLGIMQIWLDTIDLTSIEKGATLGLLSGVTTNPSILSHAENPREMVQNLLDIQQGYVAVQVTQTDVEGIVHQARLLHQLSDRIVIKIPVNTQGILAMRQLSQANIPVLGTAIIHPKQAFFAAEAGALFISPYLSHMDASGQSYIDSLKTMQDMLQPYPTKMLVASIKSISQIIECSKMDIDAITLKPDIFDAFVQNDPISESFTKKFNALWEARFPGISFSDIFSARFEGCNSPI